MRGSYRRTVCAVFVLVLVAGTGVPASATATSDPVEVEGCTEISRPGTYVLTEDIVDNRRVQLSQSCIRISASDVVFDGRNHTVDGNGVSDTTGIAVSSPDELTNVTVRNVTVSDWDRGIHYDGVSEGEIRNVTVALNGQGIALTASERNTVANNTASRNLIGIHFSRSDATRAVGNTVTENMVGIKVDGDSTNSVIAGTTAAGNERAGIYAPLRYFDLFGVSLSTGPPLDLDGDDRHEDVTGNGHDDLWDVLALSVVVTTHWLGLSDIPDDQARGLDFDGNGALGVGDVIALV